MKLVIANKAYSSWSLRPWILMRVLGIPFEEDLIPLDTPGVPAARRRLQGGQHRADPRR